MGGIPNIKKWVVYGIALPTVVWTMVFHDIRHYSGTVSTESLTSYGALWDPARLFRWALAVLCAMLVVELVQSQLKLARTVFCEAVASAKRLRFKPWPVQVLDFRGKNGDFPCIYVCLPEGMGIYGFIWGYLMGIWPKMGWYRDDSVIKHGFSGKARGWINWMTDFMEPYGTIIYTWLIFNCHAWFPGTFQGLKYLTKPRSILVLS